MSTESRARGKCDQSIVERTASVVVELAPYLQGPIRDALKLKRAEPGDNLTPLSDRRRTQIKRARDARGVVCKVIENVLFEHARDLTPFKSPLQPRSKKAALTSVAMDKFATFAERLKDAMQAVDPPVSGSDLARACNVSPAAVTKWLSGETKKLSADNYAAASRALGVREEWLRTGRLPREREFGDQEREIDQVVELLENLQEPLSALAQAIERLRLARPKSLPRRQRG